MQNQLNLNKIAATLNYNVSLFDKESNLTKLNPYQKHLLMGVFKDLNVDAVYLKGDNPLIYFKTLTSYSEETIKNLHHLIWCQSICPLLFIITPTQIIIYDSTKKPEYILDNILGGLDLAEIYNSNNDDKNFGLLKRKYSREYIESGDFYTHLAISKNKETNKVDQLLINNLNSYREKYKNKLGLSIIHDLLCRSIIILYLQDRGAINKKSFNGKEDYFEVLENADQTLNLFDDLNAQFNGDLFPVSNKERKKLKEHTYYTKDLITCFKGGDLRTGQESFFKLFNFRIIPIELISAIYEQFLIDEDKEKYGSYYTPIPLVEFILNELLPYPNEKNSNYNIKILDPSCGSGVFLVKSFQRLVERYKYSNPDEKITFEKLCKILEDNIFGIDLNEDAIKITALSLYLCVLNYLEPSTIWQDEKKKFRYLINSEKKSIDKQGCNLFISDTLKNGIFEKNKYNLIIGNPPWKRNKLGKVAKQYLEKNCFAQEISQAFVKRVIEIAPDANIALVLTTKNLFNNDSGDINFRNFLFNKCDVNLVCNFSLIGDTWFNNATSYPSVIFYKNNKKDKKSYSLPYLTPKISPIAKIVSGIVYEEIDLKYLPISELDGKNTVIWKAAMWGSYKDYINIKKFQNVPMLLKHISSQLRGGGLHKKSRNNKLLPHKFADYLLVENLDKYYCNSTTIDKFKTNYDYKEYRKFTKNIFKSPLILISEGLDKKYDGKMLRVGLLASYVDFDCLYMSSKFGIFIKETPSFLKALLAYLSSTFASYYLFLTSSSWGIDRKRNSKLDILNLPAFPYYWDKSIINKLSNNIDKIIKLKKNTFKCGQSNDDKILDIEKENDAIVLENIGLTDLDKIFIDNILEAGIDFYHEKLESIACKNVEYSYIEDYANTFCASINKLLSFQNQFVKAVIYNSDKLTKYKIVQFTINEYRSNNIIEISYDEKIIARLIEYFDHKIYSQHSERVFSRRIAKYYIDKTIYLIKPNERRFWSKAMALQDAEEIIQDSIQNKP